VPDRPHREIGDAQNVVVRINCDAETLYWLIDSLPSSDLFTRELQAAWDALMRDAAEEVARPPRQEKNHP
jgi:hypothetical protein